MSVPTATRLALSALRADRLAGMTTAAMSSRKPNETKPVIPDAEPTGPAFGRPDDRLGEADPGAITNVVGVKSLWL